jgi:hypothetical protein
MNLYKKPDAEKSPDAEKNHQTLEKPDAENIARC